MNDLKAARRAMRHLLRERDPRDAMEAYYAFHHSNEKTVLVLSPEGVEQHPTGHADGYIAQSRTGIDLFRPLVTMRLPTDRDGIAFEAASDLIFRSFAPGQPVILNTPEHYRPLIEACFEIHGEETLRLYALDPARYEPIINVLVTRSTGPLNWPRFSISSSQGGQEEVVAVASLNWQSPYFAEIAVNTRPQYRRQGWGRSVVSALSGYLLDNGRIPLYVVSESNHASAQLAEGIGFTDTGSRELLLQAVLKSRIEGVKRA